MNQKRTCGIVTLVIMSLFSMIEAAAEDTNIEKGVSYLVEMQDPAGHWNQEERKQRVDTLESFRALQRVRGGENALNNALKYFSGLSESTNENLSSKLLILSNSTADVSKLVTTLASRHV